MDNGKILTSGWVSNIIILGFYAATISGVAFVTISNTNDNKADIETLERIHKADIEKQERIHRADVNIFNKTIQEGFKELRREINAIK